MAKHTLKILQCEHRKIFSVCLTIFHYYARKGLKRYVQDYLTYFHIRDILGPTFYQSSQGHINQTLYETYAKIYILKGREKEI